MAHKLFGMEFEKNVFAIQDNISVIHYSNEAIGSILFTQGSGFNQFDEADDYKAIAPIHEKNVYGAPYFICLEEQRKSVSEWNIKNKYPFTITSNEEFLEQFPQNIIEIQKRALMLLYKKYPKYGQEISEIENYEYFAENDFDLSFILEAMKGKNYININLQKTTVGSFSINPFMIAENGWIEIEKNIESNNSKKVFVAMWFDDSMNTFFNVCEGYIPRPLAAVLRVCTLSQIPYQNNHTPTALPPPRERVLGLVDYPS